MSNGVDEDFRSLSIDDKIKHKNWKARKEGYEELAKEFTKLDAEAEAHGFTKYTSDLINMAKDSNMAAQESGLVCVFKYFENYPGRYDNLEDLVGILVQKGLVSNKAGSKAQSLNILLMLVELEFTPPIITLMIPFLKNKQPKLVAACVQVFKEIVSQFGARAVNIKEILKNLVVMFGHSDKNVRAEASELAIVIYRWINKAIDSYLTDLKPVQIKDLTAQFEAIGTAKPTAARFLRSQQAKAAEERIEEPEEQDDNADSIDEEPVMIDAYDVVEPVDITSEIPGNFYTEISSKKWQERKEVLTILQKLVDKPKLVFSDAYDQLVNSLAAHVNDTNVVVGALAVNCIELIAKGLRTSFSKYKSIALPPLLDKLKEKKQNFVDALKGALDAVYNSVSLDDVKDDIIPQLSHKNPQVKRQVVEWITRIFKTIKTAPTKGQIKDFFPGLLKTYQDGDNAVREASAECLGTIMKVVGEKVVGPFIEDLDNIKSAKVKDYFEKAEVQVKKSAAPKPVAAKKSIPVKRPDLKAGPPTRNAPPKKVVATTASKPATPSNTPVQRKSTIKSAAKPTNVAKKAPAKGPAKEISISYKFTAEDVDGLISEHLSRNILEGIQNSAWKVRLEATEAFLDYVNATPDSELEPELLIRQLQKKPGFKEANFQVMTKMFNIFQALCVNHSNFTAGCAALTMPILVDKLGDIKLKKAAGDCLEAYAERTSLKFVFDQCYPLVKAVKSPKIQGDALQWIKQTLIAFGASKLAPRSLVEFVITFLSSSNATVRSNAVSLLAEIRIYVGPQVKAFAQDLSPALLSVIDAEFAKVEGRRPQSPTRFQIGDKKVSKVEAEDPMPATEVEDEEDEESTMEGLFPRVDISPLINSELLGLLSDKSWKLRKEGLDSIKQILEAKQKRILPSVGELPAALNLRLEDVNKNLVYYTLEVCNILAESIGKPFEKVGHSLIKPICTCLNDLKPNIRDSAGKALTASAKASGLSFMIPSIALSLAPESVNLRKDLTKWLSNALPDYSKASDLISLATPLMLCLHDKNAEVRKNSQKCLELLVNSLGYSSIHSKCMSLKTSLQPEVLQVIEKFRSSEKPKPKAPTPTPPQNTGSTTLKRSSTVVRRQTSSVKPQVQEKEVPKIKSIISATSPEQKNSRLAKDKVTRWVFEVPPADLTDQLVETTHSCFSVEFHNLLFSTGNNKEKDHATALVQLNKIFDSPDLCLKEFKLDYYEMIIRLTNISDILFKILAIRLSEQTTVIIKNSLDLTGHIFKMFIENGERLNPIEAAIIVPALSQKLGHTNETLRKKVKDLLKDVCSIYSSAKIFPLLMTYGLNTKNSRGKAETLEELANIIQRDGLSVCGNPSRVCPNIAIHVGDRDAAVRNGAINVLTQVYILVGDQVYGYIGQIGSKEKSYLEERFKRTKTLAVANNESKNTKPTEPNAHVFSFQKGSDSISQGPSEDNFPTNQAKGPQQISVISDVTNGNDIYDNFGSPSSPTSSFDSSNLIRNNHRAITLELNEARDSERTMTRILRILETGDYHQVIEYLNELEKLLAGPIDEIVPFMDPLAVNLSALHYNLFNKRNTAFRHKKGCLKYVTTTFMQIFSYPLLGDAIHGESLALVIEEVIRRLLEHKSYGGQESYDLSRQLNVLMVKILDTTNPTVAFQALLCLLKECLSHTTSMHSDFEVKYSSLLIKCTWKLTRNISCNLQSGKLNPDRLLGYINHFFTKFPPSELSKRVSADDKQAFLIFKTIKTILYELCSHLKLEIRKHFNEVPVGCPDDHLSDYINTMLHKFDIKKMEDASKTKLYRGRKDDIYDPDINESLTAFLESILQNFVVGQEPSAGLIKTLHNFLNRYPNYYGVYQDELEKRGLALFDRVDELLKAYEEQMKKESLGLSHAQAQAEKGSDSDIGSPPYKKASPARVLDELPKEEAEVPSPPQRKNVNDLRSRLAEIRLESNNSKPL
ncbi:ARM repeat-containing protein [Neoconidiobolus thromboides FSU 785]|nr:ARM repeat-containing protein [Neoconidiobolus thromboides FSU 785]